MIPKPYIYLGILVVIFSMLVFLILAYFGTQNPASDYIVAGFLIVDVIFFEGGLRLMGIEFSKSGLAKQLIDFLKKSR